MKSWKWHVYIIECKDGFYYTGMTYNLDNRLEQHRIGKGSRFTSKHGFKLLRYSEEFSNIEEARKREVQLKDFSRKKKETLWLE
jgi:predicted GIY-YIG superfamily endonuclease